MFEMDDQPSDDGGFTSPAVNLKDVERVIERIRSANKKVKWQSNIGLDLKTKRWVPSAVTESRRRILHVCLTGSIPRHIASRMTEAYECDFQLFVALTIDALYSPEVLELLVDVDADVIVLQDCRPKDLSPRHFLAAMADLGVPSDPITRTQICKPVYDRIGSGSNQQKGRRFEALLAYLLSQITDFRVVERNLRTATQELDVVLQIDHHSSRAWQQHVPYMLVEAKNQNDMTPAPVVSGLMSKIRTKGQSCKMGLLISTSGFTSDAKQEELRYSESENRIVFIGPDELSSLIEAIDLDEALDELVRQARLR